MYVYTVAVFLHLQQPTMRGMLWIWIFFALIYLTKFKFTENCLCSSLGLSEFVLTDSQITGMKESATP